MLNAFLIFYLQDLPDNNHNAMVSEEKIRLTKKMSYIDKV